MLAERAGSGGRTEVALSGEGFDEGALRGLVPTGLRELVRDKLRPLPAAAADILTAGAVLGGGFGFGALTRVAGVGEAEGLSALDDLVSARLLEEGGTPSGGSYSFAHDKIREVAYTEAGEARRAVFHRRALEHLEDRGDPAAELARHALAARIPEKAFGHLLGAAEEAVAVFAAGDAVGYYERGDSEKPETSYAKRNAAEDLHQLVDRLGLSEVNLVGTDLGTMVAHAYATAYPGEICRIVLSEAMLPGFGLEEIMNVAAGGSWHFGFHMQVDLAEMLTAGKEAAYLGGMWDVMSDGGITEDDRRELLRTYAGPRGMRGGFLHYVPLLQDGKANRAAATAPLPMPVLVLNGERGLPQSPLLAGVEQLASDVQTDIVPDAAHTIGADNPEWLAERLIRLIAPAPATRAI